MRHLYPMKYLFKRLTGRTHGVRIIHADGHITECMVLRNQSPRSGMKHRWVVVVPRGVVFSEEGDTLEIDWIWPLTEMDFIHAQHPGWEGNT